MKKYIDRYNLVCVVDRKNKAPEQRIFMDRRAAISWPNATTTGYFCIFGLEDVPTIKQFKPLVLLREGKDQDIQKFCQKILKEAQEWHALKWYANLDGSDELCALELNRYLKSMKNSRLRVWNASEWISFDPAWNRQAAMAKEGSIEISKGSTLRNQLASIPADAKMDVGHYAATAFMHIITSYILSPWEKPQKEGYI